MCAGKHQCECAEGLVKVLIPAAGYGTRVAAQTKGGHKELLQLGPLTVIEHCLAMVLDSGVRDVGLVIRPGKEDVALTAESFVEFVHPGTARLHLIFQNEQKGVAHAMTLAEDFAGDFPLAVVMPDDFLPGGPPALAQMISAFENNRQNTIGAISVSEEQSGRFGNVGLMSLSPTNPEPGKTAKVISYAAKRPGTLQTSESSTFYKGFAGVIYLPGWADRIDRLVPNHQGELDDSDLVYGLLQDEQLQAVVLEGRGFDLGNENGLAAARAEVEKTGAVS